MRPSEAACEAVCSGDVTTGNFYINFIDEEQNCLWAVSEIDFVTERCALAEVAENCCESCCSACRGDAAGTSTFEVLELEGAQHDCAWAASENSAYRCLLETVLSMCCKTCAMVTGPVTKT